MTRTALGTWFPTGHEPLDACALSWRSMLASPLVVEESLDGCIYVLRFGIPGLDPAIDVSVTFHDGALRLQIHRPDPRENLARTEFNYGTYDRTIMMSTNIDEDSIRGSYHDGILEIRAMISESPMSHRTIGIPIG
jgi:HSP20 family protein